MGDSGSSETRREYLKTAGATVALGVLPTAATAKSDGTNGKKNGKKTIDDFKVEGTKKTKRKYTEDTIVVTETYRSPDLARRYGVTPPKFEKTREYDRSEIQGDKFPESGTSVTREPWESHFGTETEWEAFYTGRTGGSKGSTFGDKAREGADRGDARFASRPLSHAAPRDEDLEGEHPDGFAVWDYERVDEADNFWSDDYAYYTTSPINVIFPNQDLDTVDRVLHDEEGWDKLQSYLYQQYVRYAWDKDAEEFVPDDTSFGTADYGINGRYHVRCWENENGVVAIQAHHDDSAINDSLGHQVDSYEDCKDKIENIFSDHGFEHRTTYYMDNEKGDHDGSVSLLTEGYAAE